MRMILEAIYEPLFYDQSHGFRPGRSCHTALEQISVNFRSVKWFIEGDIKGCFDNIDHDMLMAEKDIVRRYDTQVRGICNYYCLAANYDKLKYFRYLVFHAQVKRSAKRPKKAKMKRKRSLSLFCKFNARTDI